MLYYGTQISCIFCYQSLIPYWTVFLRIHLPKRHPAHFIRFLSGFLDFGWGISLNLIHIFALEIVLTLYLNLYLVWKKCFSIEFLKSKLFEDKWTKMRKEQNFRLNTNASIAVDPLEAFHNICCILFMQLYSYLLESFPVGICRAIL